MDWVGSGSIFETCHLSDLTQWSPFQKEARQSMVDPMEGLFKRLRNVNPILLRERMMTPSLLKSVFFALAVLFVLGCGHEPKPGSDLVKLSHEEVLHKLRKFELPRLDEVEIQNNDGIAISFDSLRTIQNLQEVAWDWYQNEQGDIALMVLRPATEGDRAFRAIFEKVAEEGPDVQPVTIHCDDKVELLQRVFDRDQEMRRGEARMDPKVDHENLEMIISFLDTCGMPTLEEVDELQMAAIWAVLQHGPARYQRKYIPLLEAAAERGDIKWSVIALMKDRALMHEGKPQLYGSQFSSDGLYDLHAPEYVNQRRREMGMEPLDEYLERFGIGFDVPQREK